MEHVGEVLDRGIGKPGAGKRGPRNARGRQARDKQEQPIKTGELRDRLPHLVSLFNTSKNSSKDLSDAIKAVAEKAGLQASVVRRFVTAKAGENFDERKKEAEQLSLVFDEVK